MPKRKHEEASDDKKPRRTRERLPRTDGDASKGNGQHTPSATDLERAVAFKGAWDFLRKAGWSHTPPPRRRLDARYRYIRPGGNPDGLEGPDYLLGEASVLQYIHDLQLNGTLL
ncbi:hypothetical protein V7S43_013128 [Phytophthora oleae]|uniref:Uncharacterized protein n=1 Tax=Phytophthora oleae TaxID=2107226 RepID=A0ABD3F9Y8_9STRA